MPGRNRGKSSRRRGRATSVAVREVGRAELDVMSVTSAVGAFVNTQYLLGTDLCDRWTALALIYQRWRIKWVKFHYISQLATTNNGRVAMSIVEDADGGAPTSFQTCMEQRVAAENAGRNSFSIYYRPTHEAWLWSKDLALNEDRLEYPGFLNVSTGSFTAAGVPGYVWMKYCVEFSSPTNSTTALTRPAQILGLASKQVDTKESSETKVKTQDVERGHRNKKEVGSDSLQQEAPDNQAIMQRMDTIIQLMSTQLGIKP